jgi:hypothetical protein
MTTFTPLSAAIGGALIGLAAVLLMLLTGRLAGISHDRVPMGRERNTGRRSDIRAQRAGMIPCVPSQDLIRLT